MTDAGTSAERLLYALGQLLYALGQRYRLHHAGELPAAPRDFDVLDLVRIIGVPRDVELFTDGLLGRSTTSPARCWCATAASASRGWS